MAQKPTGIPTDKEPIRKRPERKSAADSPSEVLRECHHARREFGKFLGFLLTLTALRASKPGKGKMLLGLTSLGSVGSVAAAAKYAGFL